MTIIGFALTVFILPSHAETCPKGQHWVAPHHRSSYVRGDGVAHSASSVTGHCRTNSKVTEFWADKILNGRPAQWPNEKEVFKDWTSQEISRVIAALEKVPDWLWQDVRLFRAKSSIAKDNPASSAFRTIALYDEAFKSGRFPLDRYIAHELAHEHYENFDKLGKRSYQMAAQWKLGSDGTLKLSRPRSVAPDSKLDPTEDFANNLEAFLYEPLRLKIKSPALYDWFAIEYGDKLKK